VIWGTEKTVRRTLRKEPTFLASEPLIPRPFPVRKDSGRRYVEVASPFIGSIEDLLGDALCLDQAS